MVAGLQGAQVGVDEALRGSELRLFAGGNAIRSRDFTNAASAGKGGDSSAAEGSDSEDEDASDEEGSDQEESEEEEENGASMRSDR
jgi:ribosome biogenesis protein BMS1